MPASLSADTVAAVEDALLRGEWTQALADSRRILGERIVQLRQDEDVSVMTTEDERVLSVYLQAVFELDLADEVETAATIAKVFAPLPSGVTIQWSNFLVAMSRRAMATHALRDLLETFSGDGGVGPSVEQYAQAAEVLALQLLLPDEGIEAARQFVTGDGVLDDGTKLQLLRRIQAAHLAAQEARKEQEPSAATKQTTMNRNSGGVTSNRQLDTAFYPSASRSHNEAQQRHSRQEDDTSCYVMIGGTAIALAVAAAGALRYREKIHECVSNALPAISKGLADAKHALFEA